MLCESVVFAEIWPSRPKKNRIQFVHVFCLAFRFRRYVKALVGFRAFYFSVGFCCICEMALKIDSFCLS